MHINTVHLNLRPFSCDCCEQAFTQKGRLKTHVEDKHGNKRNHKSHVCNLCRISFIKKNQLKQHIVEIHKNLKPMKGIKPDVQGPLVFLKKLESQQEKNLQ